MKKILLASSAVVAAGLMSAPAFAADQIKLDVGGKMEQYFGYVDQDDTATFESNKTGINTDVELYFTGASTLDNGLTVGAVIELDAMVGDGDADEQYAYVEGAFGKVIAGQKNGVVSQMAVEAPQYGLGADELTDWVRIDPAFNLAADTTSDRDDASVSYVSPQLAGFSAGLTYTPTPGGALVTDAENNTHNGWEASVAYNAEYGNGIAVAADAGYMTASHAKALVNAEDQKGWRTGVVVGYQGIEVGGAYAKTDDFAGVKDDEQTVWQAGAGYKTGPYGVSLNYINSNTETAEEHDFDQWQLGATYTMGPGVTLAATAFTMDGEVDGEEAFDAAGGIMGLQLAF